MQNYGKEMKSFLATAIIFILWFLAGEFFVLHRDRAVAFFNTGAGQVKYFFYGIFSPALSEREQRVLLLKNEVLKAEIALLKANQFEDIVSSTLAFTNDLLPAKVLAGSGYPEINTIVIQAGQKAGVKEGAVVTIGGEIFLGVVQLVEKHYAVVKTIFSPGWQIPIRVGEPARSGLVKSGPEPILQMVLGEKEKQIKPGDVIFTAGRGLPYGMKIGEVDTELAQSTEGLFFEAKLRLPYDMADISEVWLIQS